MKMIVVSRELASLEAGAEINTYIRENGIDSKRYEVIFPKEDKYKVEEIKAFTNQLAKKQANPDEEYGYILMKADALSDICQNALLKTLEESRYSILLSVKNIDSLLQTIKSRCEVKYFGAVEINKIQFDTEMISLKEVPALSKLEREEVVQRLENLITSTPLQKFELILLIQEAIKKLHANCKIESILYELIYKAKG